MRISLPSLSSTTAKRSKRLRRPRRCRPVTSSRYIVCPSLRLWKRYPSWILMLCLAMRPPGTPVLGISEYPLNSPFKFLTRKPGHIRLFPKPGLLAFGEAPSFPDRLGNRLLERPSSLQMTDKLTISDGLKCGQIGRETPPEQFGDLFDPSRLEHSGHAACNFIV